MEPIVWAVLPTHNRPALLRESLQGLQAQTRPLGAILVVLNASPPEVKAMLSEEFPQVEVLELSENLGSAGGFHHGMKYAFEQGADWIWLVDDDGIAVADALEKLLKAEQILSKMAPAAQILLSRVVWTDGRIHPMNFPGPDWRRPGLLWKALNYGYLLIRSGAWTGMLVHRSAIAQYGLPHKDYFVWCEDLEFSGRVLRQGVGYWVFDSLMVHKTKAPTAAVGEYGDRFFFEVRNRIWLVRSDAFGPLGKIYWTLHFMGELAVYLWGAGRKGLDVVQRGFRAGFSSRPELEK